MASSPTSSTGPAAGDLSGRLLANRYRLNKPLAAGGMAEVWEATDQILTRRVAVKLLHAHLARDESFVRRFRAEAIAAARLAHPSIVSVYDTFSEDGLEAIVMELVVGTTMRADLDQHGPLRLDAILAIGTQVADALGAAHASGLVHRDVKPANILLSADGRVLVADFGIAKAAEGSDLTSDGSMVGTAKYLAPEQVEGTALDGRADLYALGVVLYEALTGTPPFVADTDTGTAFARLHRDPVPPRRIRPQIPPAVEAVVMCAMARRRDDRYPDARSMRAALLGAGADPSRAPAAAVAAVAATSGEHPRALAASPPGAPPVRPPRPPVRMSASPPPRPPMPVPGPGPERLAPAEPLPSERRVGRRRWPWVALAALVAVAAVAGGAAVATRGAETPALPIPGVLSFDPFDPEGEFTENDAQLPLAGDGDPTTVWTTEDYANPNLADAKGGVGLVLQLRRVHDLGRVEVRSPDRGWAASVYVVTGTDPSPSKPQGELPADLDGWGKPVGGLIAKSAGVQADDLGGAKGNHVMIWFTRVPASGEMHVAEAVVREDG